MSSVRFPGKVLAPLLGKPIISHVIESCTDLANINETVVITSNEQSDNPLGDYLAARGSMFFRGPLLNVFQRFQMGLDQFPCDYVVRISGDSPFICRDLINFMVLMSLKLKNKVLFSNVFSKSFPKGQSIEIIKSDLLSNVDVNSLDANESEHVFPYFYKYLDPSLCYFPTLKKNNRKKNYCIDTVADIERVSLLDEFKFDKSDLK